MKSTIDWCELNYIESEYIAEYWNSITGVFLIMEAILDALATWNTRDEKKIIFYSL